MILNINPTMPFYVLTVNTVAGATVTATKGVRTHTVTANSSGIATFSRLMKGTWTVVATYEGVKGTATVIMDTTKSQSISINMIPTFTYKTSTGNKGYEIVNDSDIAIASTSGNWKIRFLESGELTFSRLGGAANGIDVFCVGGGGAGSSFRITDADGGGEPGRGGGGGYTKTKPGVTISANKLYTITVGKGGTGSPGIYAGEQAESTSAFGVTAEGGYSGALGKGGNGGSGGGAPGHLGGEDGKNGDSWGGGEIEGGKGQGTTTREFGETSGNLYSTGGTGGALITGTQNWGLAGNGGIGARDNASKGSDGDDGIVIIRNAR